MPSVKAIELTRRAALVVVAVIAACPARAQPMSKATLDVTGTVTTCTITSSSGSVSVPCSQSGWTVTLDPGQTATMQFTLNYHYADDGLALPTGTSAPSGPFGPPLGPAGPVLVTNFTGPAGYTGPTATHEAASFFVDMSGCAAGSGFVSCLPTSVGSFLGTPASNTFPYDNGRFSGVVISDNSVADSFDGQASFVARSKIPAPRLSEPSSVRAR